jgi:predicted Zn finger-like uncharacterized protein
MKFLCPNCKAKYRIGPEKMVGRQAAKIRCRKCDYLIQIAYRNDSDEFDVTATPPSAPPPAAAASRAPKPTIGQPAAALASARPRAPLEEGSASRKPTAAVPGLPGLGSAKSTRGAALVSEVTGTSRRPLAPLPPPPVAPNIGGSLANGASSSIGVSSDASARSSSSASNGASSGASASAPRSAGSTQLGDQFRESVQAGASDDLPREGWFVGVNGVPLGPIPLGDLRELAIAGHIDRRSLVWREGQAEWRPLGKFPGLARVIDDGAGPPATPLPEPSAAPAAPPPSPVPPSPPVARSNGAGSQSATGAHVASGFDVVRPDLSERPSAWGDLDDEDDDDEQPTTVKGRVSVMPASSPMPVSMAPPSAAHVLPQAAPPPAPPAVRANTTSAPAPFAAMAPAPSTSPSMSSPAVFGGIADVDPPAPSRTRWYLIAAAIVFAFALGAVVTHLMRSSAADKPAPTGSAQRSSQVIHPLLPERAARAAAIEAPERSGPSRSPPVLTSRAAPVDPSAASAFDTEPSPPSPTPPSRAALLSVGSESLAARRSGRAGAHRATSGRATLSRGTSGASGLDAKTVQRTVRRYSPAVRQSCWHPALGARAPGAPASARVTASISVEPGGRVRAVSVSRAPRGFPGLARCIEDIVQGWRFPRASTPTITSVPFVFLGR